MPVDVIRTKEKKMAEGKHRMKKSLIIVLAVVLVVSSVIAGTMALYTTNVDNIGQATVTAKHFFIGAGSADNFASDLVIAPGESVSSTFEVTNTDSLVSAVDITVVLTLTQSGDIPDNMEVTVKLGDASLVETGDGTYTFEMAKNVEFNETITVTYYWNSLEANSIDKTFVDKSFNYSVTLVGTQKV